jgi:hypothetical protein
MKAVDFFDKIEEHEELEGLGVTDKAAVVRHIPTGLKTSVGIDDVADSDWDILEEIITGKREPDVLKHMTRVVGYFSTTNNWNKSKIGELKDRQKGNYAIEG